VVENGVIRWRVVSNAFKKINSTNKYKLVVTRESSVVSKKDQSVNGANIRQ
jgi:hypothetical protein